MALNDTVMELLRRQTVQTMGASAKSDVRIEWTADVDAVMGSIRATLTPFVEDGTASIKPEPIDITEELIGTYSAQRLRIAIAGVNVLVEPVARFTFGGTGRIDMYRERRSSEEDRMLILRPSDLPSGERAPWLIETRKLPSSEDFVASGGIERGSRRYVPFDRAGIEGALDHLLMTP